MEVVDWQGSGKSSLGEWCWLVFGCVQAGKRSLLGWEKASLQLTEGCFWANKRLVTYSSMKPTHILL